MGIQCLNSFIKKNTNEDSIKIMHMNTLYGKIIVIDASIYLYRYLIDGILLENIYIMISIFRYYNITPIFVFDGKAPLEKNHLLDKRNNDKIKAEEEYNYLLKKIEDNNLTYKEHDKLNETLNLIKKKCVRLKKHDIKIVQELMDAFGIKYIEAKGEADALCAKLVIKKIAYACLSEDMDLFVYGCPRVLRYLSLVNQTVVIYSLNHILSDLNLSLREFKEICVISGTDYTVKKSNIDLYTIMQYFRLYKKDNFDNKIDFYTWLDNNTDYIDNIYELYNNYNMFSIENIALKPFNIELNKKKCVDLDKVKAIMMAEGFIFLK